jgi:hypothetical protein
MYSLGTLFVSGIYVQIPCIKEIMTIIIIIIIIIKDGWMEMNDVFLFTADPHKDVIRSQNIIYSGFTTVSKP